MWKKFDSMDPLLQMRRKKKKESHFEGSPMIPRVSHTHTQVLVHLGNERTDAMVNQSFLMSPAKGSNATVLMLHFHNITSDGMCSWYGLVSYDLLYNLN